MKNMKLYRQGDVLLISIPKNQVPKNLKAVPPKNGRVILAYGEVTGHHHSMDATNSQEWVDDAGVTWLEVNQAVELLHQEHAPISLPDGFFKKIQQKEYSPAEIRRVID